MEKNNELQLANNLQTSQETLDLLSKSPSEQIRALVARNASASQETLLHMIGDPCPLVIENLIKNNTPFSLPHFEVAVSKHTRLRLATVEDAEFILSLRLNETLNRFVSPVEYDILKQRHWLEQYKEREKCRTEFYFIISSAENKALGAVRMYDFKIGSFSWGSWMIHPDAPFYTSIESALSIYEFAFYILCFHKAHFKVMKNNTKVVKFHENFGAQRVSSDSESHYYNFNRNDYSSTRQRYKKFFRD